MPRPDEEEALQLLLCRRRRGNAPRCHTVETALLPRSSGAVGLSSFDVGAGRLLG